MPFYRAYVVDQQNRFRDVHDLECTDDTEAIQRAEQLVDGHDVELWHFDRMVARLTRHHDHSGEKDR